ncbi:MAG: tetratricopeptide repeat protein, partial [Gemmatimonadales bacterium]
RHWVLWTGSVLLTAAFLWLRATVVGGLAGVHAAPGIEGEGVARRALVMAPVVLEYVRLLVFPLRLSADYSPDFLRPVAQVTLTGFAGFAAVLLAVLVAVQNRDRAPVVSFGLAWIGGTLLIISNVLVPTGLLLAERSLYLPSVGAVLLAGWAAGWVAVRRKDVAVAVVALVVAAGLARTILRVEVWRSPGPFLAQLVRDAPGSYRSFWVASLLAYETGNRERGEELALRALEIQPAFPNLWQDVGRRYVEDERWLEAAHAFRAEFRLDSARQLAAAEAIVNYVRAGELDSAAAVGERAQRLDPTDYRVMIARSDLALARGRPLEAMTLRRQVAWQFLGVWQYWHLTADAALEAGHCPEVERSMARMAALHGEGEPLPSLVERSELARCEVGE